MQLAVIIAIIFSSSFIGAGEMVVAALPWSNVRSASFVFGWGLPNFLPPPSVLFLIRTSWPKGRDLALFFIFSFAVRQFH